MEQRLNHLCERLDKIEKTVDDKGDMFEQRITTLERRVDVSDQKFIQVFEKLDEIISILKEHGQRLPNLVYGVLGAAAGGSIAGVIVWLFTK